MSPRAGARRSGVDIAAMLELIGLTDYIVAHSIRCAAELGLADALADGPRPVAELALEVGADPAALLRLFRALACNGVFTETQDGSFALTDLAEPLRQNHPHSVRALLPLSPTELYAWADFHETMRSGEPAFPRVHGRPFYEHLAAHPDERARYDAAQSAMCREDLAAALGAYPWHGLARVVDVAGGRGDFLAGLLAANPGLNGTLVDLPEAVAGAEDLFARYGVTERADVQPLDPVTQPLPKGADAYLLKRALCSRDAKTAVGVLNAVRAAAGPDGRVLVFEPVREPGRVLDESALSDLVGLVFTGGRVRALGELDVLFAEAGLRTAAVHPAGAFPIVEAVPR